MATYNFRLNGRPVSVDAWDSSEPLLYVLRGTLGLHGPKFGCGLGQCGACTVLADKQAMRSCTLPVSRAAGREITTIEGLGTPDTMSPVQAAFVTEQAAQCGYCTNGMIVAADGATVPHAQADAGSGEAGHGRQPVPLRHPHPHHPGCDARVAGIGGQS